MSSFVGIIGLTRGFEDILGVVASITLIAFLIAKELLTTSRSQRALGRFLHVVIIPMLIVFVVTVAVEVMAVL